MTEQDDDGLLAIEVDADDYAEAAADDAPTVSRTYQSEVDFHAQRSSYSAKIHNGNNYNELLQAIPVLRPDYQSDTVSRHGEARLKLSKKDIQLLGYAVGKMYYDRRYEDVVGLCNRVRDACEVDGKTKESLERWMERCKARLAAGSCWT